MIQYILEIPFEMNKSQTSQISGHAIKTLLSPFDFPIQATIKKSSFWVDVVFHYAMSSQEQTIRKECGRHYFEMGRDSGRLFLMHINLPVGTSEEYSELHQSMKCFIQKMDSFVERLSAYKEPEWRRINHYSMMENNLLPFISEKLESDIPK